MERRNERVIGNEKVMAWQCITSEPVGSSIRRNVIRTYIAALDDALSQARGEDLDRSIEAVKADYLAKIEAERCADDQLWLKAMLFTLSDLANQRWRLRYDQGHILIQRPPAFQGREEMRERLVARRNQQLQERSVREFVANMEKWRLIGGRRASIFSLMCDGRSMEKRLLDSQNGSEPVVKPYLQVAASDATCEFTGLKLTDIWRYFRHTWSNPYESIPGRSMLILVRDASWPNHPVIGIAALSSAAIRLSARDTFIGWDTEHLIQRISREATAEHAEWILHVIRRALSEIYVADFVRDGVVSPIPTENITAEAIEVLQTIATKQKEAHHRLMESADYGSSKQAKNASDEDWERQAQTPLFRSKRAGELANLLDLWSRVNRAYDGFTGAERIKALISSKDGRDALSKVIRVARSMKVGTAIADLTVCGAIAPYNHLAGGKLVAMLAASPEAVVAYENRYRNADSIIASSMAGRRINRPAHLVFIGTSSLYGRRPNQYDRITFPCADIGGEKHDAIKYHYIRDESAAEGGSSNGVTKGVGTFHFSAGTLRALEDYSVAERGGWRVNNVFGEGTNPKMRAIREGVRGLGLDADQLLVHGIGKCLYGVPLVRNLRDYLLGISETPDFIFDTKRPQESTQRIANWWLSRWAMQRLDRKDVLSQIRSESLIHPIRHRARVVLPRTDSQLDLI